MGAERNRFDQAEIKDYTRFKTLIPFEFEHEYLDRPTQYSVVHFVVDKGSISFHHALHYTLSWLIECGKSMSREKLRDLLLHAAQDIKENHALPNYEAESYLMAMFDFPLRVCCLACTDESRHVGTKRPEPAASDVTVSRSILEGCGTPS